MSPAFAQPTLPPGAAQAMPEALALLRADHDALREVFDRYRRLAGQCAPAAADSGADAADAIDARDDDLVRMTGVECETCRKIIRQVRGACPTEPRFDALMVALAQCVERRLRREETELFGRVRRSHADLADLGLRIRRRHEAWLAS